MLSTPTKAMKIVLAQDLYPMMRSATLGELLALEHDAGPFELSPPSNELGAPKEFRFALFFDFADVIASLLILRTAVGAIARCRLPAPFSPRAATNSVGQRPHILTMRLLWRSFPIHMDF
jgi:hypothetical protein